MVFFFNMVSKTFMEIDVSILVGGRKKEVVVKDQNSISINLYLYQDGDGALKQW